MACCHLKKLTLLHVHMWSSTHTHTKYMYTHHITAKGRWTTILLRHPCAVSMPYLHTCESVDNGSTAPGINHVGVVSGSIRTWWLSMSPPNASMVHVNTVCHYSHISRNSLEWCSCLLVYLQTIDCIEHMNSFVLTIYYMLPYINLYLT